MESIHVILLIVVIIGIFLLVSRSQEDFETGRSSLEKVSKSKCKIDENDQLAHDYVRKNLVKDAKLCSRLEDSGLEQCNAPTPDDFRNDFYNFRNTIMQDSNGFGDSVDKIADLYLTNNSEVARDYTGRTIGDLFDELTRH